MDSRSACGFAHSWRRSESLLTSRRFLSFGSKLNVSSAELVRSRPDSSRPCHNNDEVGDNGEVGVFGDFI